jgi:hypothetical protein
MQARRQRPLVVAVRIAAAVAGVVLGGFLVLLGAVVGSCDAFGGTCPSPPGLHGDVYGTIAAGLALAVAAPVVAWRPDRRGIATAAAVGFPVVIVGAYVLGRSALS